MLPPLVDATVVAQDPDAYRLYVSIGVSRRLRSDAFTGALWGWCWFGRLRVKTVGEYQRFRGGGRDVVVISGVIQHAGG